MYNYIFSRRCQHADWFVFFCLVWSNFEAYTVTVAHLLLHLQGLTLPGTSYIQLRIPSWFCRDFGPPFWNPGMGLLDITGPQSAKETLLRHGCQRSSEIAQVGICFKLLQMKLSQKLEHEFPWFILISPWKHGHFWASPSYPQFSWALGAIGQKQPLERFIAILQKDEKSLRKVKF